jgi:Asp-tRNA(Asn)/Glu-tRNA(Gln) amidotransferase A subunit family amidase
MSHREASRTRAARLLTGSILALLVAAISVLAGSASDRQSASPRTGVSGAGRPVAVDAVERSIEDLQQSMQAGTLTARDLAATHLARIAAYDKAGPALNALIALNPRAIDDAGALDQERRAGKVRGPLHGIPVVIKDNYETRDMPTTGGSIALAGFVTGRDAFQVRKLRDAGVVILGKTNLHELAAGIITISSMGGQTRNPYDPARTPGGSSGGTAAAVAAGFAVAGMASDTCGSIRIPAANNNLFGLRGTAGLSSRTGIIPLSHTQDIGGPLARTVTDLALMLDATVGEDPADPVTAAARGQLNGRFRDQLAADALKGARIGVLKVLFGSSPEDEEVTGIVRKALEVMKAQGAELVDVQIPGLEEILNQSSLINLEFKIDLQGYLSQFPNAPVRSLQDILDRGLFHAALENTFKLRNAAVADPEEIRKVEARRELVRQLVRTALAEYKVDALAYPTLRRRPVVVEEPQRGTTCQLSATSGFPSMAMPAGFTPDGVPIGFELLGSAWSDQRLMSLAYAYEQVARPRRPAPTTPPLVNGAAPGLATIDVGMAPGGGPLKAEFDPISGRFTIDLPPAVTAAAVHRGEPGPDGPVLQRLLDPASSSHLVTVTLPPYQRPLLQQGALRLVLQTASGRTVHPLTTRAR